MEQLEVTSLQIIQGLAISIFIIPFIFIIIYRVAGQKEFFLVFSLYILGWITRIVIGLFIFTNIPAGVLSGDHIFYTETGRHLMEYWKGNSGPPTILLKNRFQEAIYYYNAFLFYLFGYNPLIPMFITCHIGAMSGILAYSICRILSTRRAAIAGLVLLEFFPSQVLWGSLNLKDSHSIFLILLTFLTTIKYIRDRKALWMIFTLASLALLWRYRIYVSFILMTAVMFNILFSVRNARNLFSLSAITIILLPIFFYYIPSFNPDLIIHHSFSTLDEIRSHLSVGTGAYLEEFSVNTPEKALFMLIPRLVYFVLSPFPWSISNARQLLALPEVYILLILFPYIFYGALKLIKTRAIQSFLLVFYSIIFCISYSLAEGNIGTLFRHRLQVVVVFLLFAVIGKYGVSEKSHPDSE